MKLLAENGKHLYCVLTFGQPNNKLPLNYKANKKIPLPCQFLHFVLDVEFRESQITCHGKVD